MTLLKELIFLTESANYNKQIRSDYHYNSEYAEEIIRAKDASIALKKLLPEFRIVWSKGDPTPTLLILPKSVKSSFENMPQNIPYIIVRYNGTGTNRKQAEFFDKARITPKYKSSKIDNMSIAEFARRHMPANTD